MRTLKRENKGFSLVELIVVVLILGILAVAVTPQVMKWVGKSKVSADKDSANALKSAITTALADWQGQDNGKIGTSDITCTVGASNAKVTSIPLPSAPTGWDSSLMDELVARIDEVTAGDYPVTKNDINGFDITIEATTGKVTVECDAQDVTD